MITSDTCGICGGLVRSTIEAGSHPGRWAHLARLDMQKHLDTHSFAEVLRFEIRQDLQDVPEEQRPTIVRDIYRNLLGTTTPTHFVLNDADGLGVYTIDEALGDLAVYRHWRNANNCGLRACKHD